VKIPTLTPAARADTQRPNGTTYKNTIIPISRMGIKTKIPTSIITSIIYDDVVKA